MSTGFVRTLSLLPELCRSTPELLGSEEQGLSRFEPEDGIVGSGTDVGKMNYSSVVEV